ncbi:hypothetical protein BZA05DRAFT_176143 [Tricharina praecox]|uniref:uncharacterized protein n=1 Tax=Tricharina praecox TaxID=43433 RepID=UPI00221F73C4|nr:uncharacterized protein BZA05DRAFT_176143 [Tricharina praecox]KAI5844124.1 hypothetical protein BZA05DRAFT_176143 [Tricharina praecox]
MYSAYTLRVLCVYSACELSLPACVRACTVHCQPFYIHAQGIVRSGETQAGAGRSGEEKQEEEEGKLPLLRLYVDGCRWLPLAISWNVDVDVQVGLAGHRKTHSQPAESDQLQTVAVAARGSTSLTLLLPSPSLYPAGFFSFSKTRPVLFFLPTLPFSFHAILTPQCALLPALLQPPAKKSTSSRNLPSSFALCYTTPLRTLNFACLACLETRLLFQTISLLS